MRKISEADIQTVLNELEVRGLQSDARFAEAFIRGRASQAYGPRRIRMELSQRGIDPELIDRAMTESGEDWAEIAKRYYRRQFKERLPADYKERAKRLRHMQQRGFDMNTLRVSMEMDARLEED